MSKSNYTFKYGNQTQYRIDTKCEITIKLCDELFAEDEEEIFVTNEEITQITKELSNRVNFSQFNANDHDIAITVMCRKSGKGIRTIRMDRTREEYLKNKKEQQEKAERYNKIAQYQTNLGYFIELIVDEEVYKERLTDHEVSALHYHGTCDAVTNDIAKVFVDIPKTGGGYYNYVNNGLKNISLETPRESFDSIIKYAIAGTSHKIFEYAIVYKFIAKK